LNDGGEIIKINKH